MASAGTALVLDLALPGLGRVDGLSRVGQLSPATRTFALSDKPSQLEAISAFKARAMGYCASVIDPLNLAKAVDAIARGEMWIERKLTSVLVSSLLAGNENTSAEMSSKPDRRLDCLTLRQREVADAIAMGASNKEIANRLNVTERTIKAHLTEMFRNVGVMDRLQLALLLNKVPHAKRTAPGIHVTAPLRRERTPGATTGRGRGPRSRRSIVATDVIVPGD
jgi:DNA-binding NarL/FixJ family response regulator